MAVDYRLLRHFQESTYMEAAIREAADGVAARRRQLTPDNAPPKPANVLAFQPPLLWVIEDDG